MKPGCWRRSGVTKTILHVDINSYFATILQQENPHLRGKPLAILKDVGRSCVIAASKEAKQFGVKTGSRLADAKQICPQIITLPAKFDRYLDCTKRLQRIFANIAPNYYIYSLDEAFVDVTDCLNHLYPNPQTLAKDIQDQIKKELGEWVTCNVGISHNRLLAKMASEIAPKGSALKIDESNMDSILASVPFSDVCGIGFRLEKKLRRLGVTVPYQIRFFSAEQLQIVFGPFWSQELLKIAYGLEPHHLSLIDRHQPHMKSVGRSITGYRLYGEEKDISRILLNLMEEVTYKVRKMKLAGRYAGIYLTGQGESWSAHQTLTPNYYIRHTNQLFNVLYRQLYQSWQRSFKIIKFAVRLGMLKPISEVPQPLFARWHQQEAVYKAMDKISDKYGLFTLRSGALLNQPVIRPEVTGFLGDRLYQLR
jgi:DNA polymerase IV